MPENEEYVQVKKFFHSSGRGRRYTDYSHRESNPVLCHITQTPVMLKGMLHCASYIHQPLDAPIASSYLLQPHYRSRMTSR